MIKRLASKPIKLDLEPLASMLVSVCMPFVGDSYLRSRQCSVNLSKKASKFQSKLRQLFDIKETDLNVIALSDRNNYKIYRDWEAKVSAKFLAIVINPGDDEICFHLRKDDFEKIVKKGGEIADKLGLKFIVARFIYKVEDSPDSGSIYELKTMQLTDSDTVKVSFAFGTKGVAYFSRSKAEMLYKEIYSGILGHKSDSQKKQQGINLLIDFRSDIQRLALN